MVAFTVNACLGDSCFRGHRADTPMDRAIFRLGLQSRVDQRRDALIRYRARRSWADLVIQPGNPSVDEPLPPFTDRCARHLEPEGNIAVRFP